MQKAAEDLKNQQAVEMEEKKMIIEARVPKLEIDGMEECKTGMACPSGICV